ncbi:RHS repeat-associated core domain-containing protein [Pseudomonas sp. Marseille-Q5115]|uniref:RHS repeat-associated core domain-containing protein n=1 Tax=Pseudomonas sp. Marseille-Q5115 TaxID=2866593 RepID=UPI001CE3D5C4|nr:RHS repeat-associated core domain-containing protein [Pseudomonas sp. Marseille-Q5115]
MNTLLSRSTPAYTRLACDRNRSVLGNSGLQRAYTPFGHVPPGGAALAFNGERPERASGRYVLGHGYRAYSPTLMRFERSDDDSPFGKGGINSYAYCGAEPMNNRDPSGHGAVFGMFGIVLGAIIMAWGGIERATGNESKSNVLLGIGGGIIAFSVFGTITGSMKGSRTMRRRIDRPNGIALTERRGHI